MATSLKARIRAVADHYGLSIRALEDKCGLSRSLLGNMTDSSTLGSDKLSKILDALKDIDPIWLISGHGNMLKSSYQEVKNMTTCYDLLPTRPRIPFTAQAGALTEMTQTANFDDVEQIPVIATFPDYDFTIPVDGDSMSPEYLPGDELACAKLSSNDEIKWGRAYLLDTARGVVVKQIFDGGDRILCHSVNPDHKDYVIDKSDIYSIYAIVGYTRTA